MKTALLRLTNLAVRLRDDARGVSALEFALVLPILLTLFLGGVEVSEAVTMSRKVTNVTSTLADLVTQSSKISDDDMKNILDASAAVMAPYPAADLRIVVSGVSVDKNGKATVTWSDARNAQALSRDSEVGLPNGLDQKNTFLVMADVTYAYSPKIGYVIAGSFDLNDGFFLRPRVSDTVSRTR